METLFESPRHFKLWRYSVSHKVLLLRSPRDEQHSTRVDVVFAGVSRIQLNTAYDGLTIAKGDLNLQLEVESQLSGPLYREMGLFIIGDSAGDYVLSGPPAWHEDEGSYRDPSFFEGMLML